MEKLIKIFKVLSDETRLRIVSLLAEGDLCVCQIYGVLEESQPKVSKHLAKMRDLGIVSIKKQEQYVYYSLNRESETYSMIFDLISSQRESIERLKDDYKKLYKKDEILNSCNPR
jgi:ArsR family transcriptional regulator